MPMKVKRYSTELMPLWDAFVRTSRNGIFMFLRQYVEYHADRFPDHSLMLFDDTDRLVALLPATEQTDENQKVFSSHAGLTFGGFVLSPQTKAHEVISLFSATLGYLSQHHFDRFVYKAAPVIYHQCPSEDVDYALWLNGAHLAVCNLSTCIDLHSPLALAFDRNRRRGQRKALRRGYSVAETDDLGELWPIVTESLISKYGVQPVHSMSEIALLRQRFPHNIRIVVARLDGKVSGGIVIYESAQVAHSQYAHATPEAKASGVIDMLYIHLIEYYKSQRPEIRYFDFGISNTDGGLFLNRNLIAYKEDYGGRGVSYKTYVIDLRNSGKA